MAKSTSKSSSATNSSAKEKSSQTIIKTFSDHYNVYLDSIGKIYDVGIGEYKDAYADLLEMVDKYSVENQEVKESTDSEVKKSLREAWRQGDYSKLYGPEYYNIANSYTEAQSKVNRNMEEIYKQYYDRLEKLSSSQKESYKKAFEQHSADVQASWSGLKTSELDPNTLYSIGYLNMAASMYGYLTSS